MPAVIIAHQLFFDQHNHRCPPPQASNPVESCPRAAAMEIASYPAPLLPSQHAHLPDSPSMPLHSTRTSIHERRSCSAEAALSSKSSMSLRSLPSTEIAFCATQPPRTTRGPPISGAGLGPLSPICASPICTPSISVCSLNSNGILNALSTSNSTGSIEKYVTPPTSPGDLPLPRMLPSWVAVPPTPPQTLAARRSVPQLRRILSLPPSTSFPPLLPSREASPAPACPKRSASLSSSTPRIDPSTSQATNDRDDKGQPASSRRALFHLSPDSNGDEDGADAIADSPSPEDLTEPPAEPPADSGASEPSQQMEDQRKKDNVRKYHALLELITTEVGYLLDLRTLVNVYLHNLTRLNRRPSTATTAFSRSSSFAATSRSTSSINIHPNSVIPYPVPDSSLVFQDKEKGRGNLQRIFTDAQIALLSCNAEEILQLHERFVQELYDTVQPLWPHTPIDDKDAEIQELSDDRLHEVICAVSAKFATESSRFCAYQSYCTGHREALNLIRRSQDQYSSDWNTFEQDCALFVAFQSEETGRRRGMEIPLPPSFSWSFEASNTSSTAHPCAAQTSAFPEEPSSPCSSLSRLVTSSVFTQKARSHRLAFLDYMIKPIQRICKYPLILQQMKSKGCGAAYSDVDVVVESATQAMRHIASSVDEARHRQDIALQSNLIKSRISASTAPNYSSSLKSFFGLLTPDFMSSLGTCLLAGSLDVIHYRPSVIPKAAKYMGAFLYLGGYLILVKVRGKVYEPRHWFPLAGFKVADLTMHEAMLPCSFRLSCKNHEFELAAACQGEKEVWMSAIHESLSCRPSWTGEPNPSTQYDDKGMLTPPAEVVFPVSPDEDGSKGLPAENSGPTRNMSDGSTRQHSWSTPHSEDPTSHGPRVRRRSSSASIKNLFASSSEPPTMVISRSSAGARLSVDHWLQDVVSEPCLTARSHANRRDEGLFAAPKLSRRGMPRSNSGLSMSGVSNAARKRLTRHESVRVPRRKSFVEGSDGEVPTIKSFARPRPPPLASAFARQLSPNSDAPSTSSSLEASQESPFPSSQCSSIPPSDQSSVNSSPILGATRRLLLRHDHIRDPSHPRPMSDTGLPSISEKSLRRFSSIFRLWTRGGSHHTRSRSASDSTTVVGNLGLADRDQSYTSVLDDDRLTLPPVEFGADGFTESALSDLDHSVTSHEPPPSTDAEPSYYALKKTDSTNSFSSITLLHRFLKH